MQFYLEEIKNASGTYIRVMPLHAALFPGMLLLPTYDPGPESGVVRLGATLMVLISLPTILEDPTKEI